MLRSFEILNYLRPTIPQNHCTCIYDSIYLSIYLPIMSNPVGDLDICASSCRNDSKAKNKEVWGGVVTNIQRLKIKISEDTGYV